MEVTMDWNRIEGNWKEAKGKIKQKWGQLTDDDLAQINGRRDQLEGRIQQRYGLAKDLVRKDIDDWLDAQPERPDASLVGREHVMSSSEDPQQRSVIPARQARQGVIG